MTWVWWLAPAPAPEPRVVDQGWEMSDLLESCLLHHSCCVELVLRTEEEAVELLVEQVAGVEMEEEAVIQELLQYSGCVVQTDSGRDWSLMLLRSLLWSHQHSCSCSHQSHCY